MNENPTDAAEQYEFGNKYYYGDGVPKDKEKANYWYTMAAEQGYEKAQYDLGYNYTQGDGVPEDFKKAVYWYTKAAKQGYANAQNNLGTLFVNGFDVPKNGTKAKYWHKKAAKQGNEVAKSNLYKCNYSDTKGVILSIIGALVLGSIMGKLFGYPSVSGLGFIIGAVAGWFIVREMRKRL